MTVTRPDGRPSPRTGLNLLVLLAFLIFCLMKSVFICIAFTRPDVVATVWDLHLLAYQSVANIAFTAGAATAVASLRTKHPRRSWWLAAGGAAGAAVGFALLFVEAYTSPPVFTDGDVP